MNSEWSLIWDAKALLGEAPEWNESTHTLAWVDMMKPAIGFLNTLNGIQRYIPMPEKVTTLIRCRQGGYIVSTHKTICQVNTLESSPHLLPLAKADNRLGWRFNDGRCDAKGRFWIGAMALSGEPNAGKLFCFNAHGQLVEVLNQLHIPNGLGWSPDGQYLYLTDTGKRCIYRYAFDLGAGQLSDPHCFFQMPEHAHGKPDGLTIDANGYLWSALWDGWKIIRITPCGILDREIDLPIPRPTSCVFGGGDFTTLYVTSARTGLSNAQLEKAPLSGGIFSIKTDVVGLASFPYGYLTTTV